MPKVTLSPEVANLKAGLDWMRILQLIQLLIDFLSSTDGSPDKVKEFAKSKGATEEECDVCALSCANLCAALKLHQKVYEDHS